jgi:hypothetical protein
MILTKVRAALRTKLLAQVGEVPVAWENRPYAPVNGTPFLRERFVPQQARLVSLGPGGIVRHRGTLFLDYFHPTLVGLAAADGFVDTLLAALAPGTQLVYQGVTVTLESASRAGAQIDSQWVLTPCTIVWYADWNNTAV